MSNLFPNVGGFTFAAKPMCIEWDITVRPVKTIKTVRLDENGNYVNSVDQEVGQVSHTSHGHNLVVNNGRSQLISLAFVPSASSIGGFYYLGVGASATTAQVTDTRLTYELIGNATRKTLTNVNGNQPTSADIQLETYVVSSCTFYEKIVLQTTYTTTDGNNNNTFNEYGLFTLAALPASPVSTSGVMFNHYTDANPAFKASTNQVTVAITVRF